MVLQNKYKARASRRYNSARGGASDGRGRGRGGGRGGASRIDQASFPSLPGQQQSDEGEEEDGEEDDDEGEEKGEAKYAPRKLVSNAWRFDEPTDDDAADEEEPEPEVDLSGLLERVAKLDSSRTSKALSSDRAAQLALDAEAADVDASLLHLLDRQRERERRAAATTSDQANGDSATAAAAAVHALPRHVLTDEQRAELEREGRRLQEEKVQREKHERRARVLQHSGAAKTISLDIGSSRRRDREGDEERKTQRRNNVASAKGTRLAPHLLYDSDEEERDGGDVTDFLDELQRKTESGANKPAITSVRRHDSPTNSTTRPAAPSTAKDEDFLDSIL